MRSDKPALAYRARDLVEQLHISESTLWRWVREGKFPKPVKLGEAVTAWRARDVEAWLDARAAQ